MGKCAQKIQPFLEHLAQSNVPEGPAALAQHQVHQADRIIRELTFQTPREGAAWVTCKKKEEARDKWVHAMQLLRREIPDETLQGVNVYKERLTELRPALAERSAEAKARREEAAAAREARGREAAAARGACSPAAACGETAASLRRRSAEELETLCGELGVERGTKKGRWPGASSRSAPQRRLLPRMLQWRRPPAHLAPSTLMAATRPADSMAWAA